MEQHDGGLGVARAEIAHDDRPKIGKFDESTRGQIRSRNVDVSRHRLVVRNRFEVEFLRFEFDGTGDVGLAQTVSTFRTLTVS